MTVSDASQYNAQTKTRFILGMDLSNVIGDSEATRNLRLNCYSVGTPEISAGVSYQSFNGYQIPIPNGKRDEEKVLEVKFIVSESMVQYAAMLKWISVVTLQTDSEQEVSDDYRTTVELWVLDSYLKPLPTPITYEGAFITRLGRLDFDQSDQDGGVLKCSASLAYYRSLFDYDKVLGLA